MSLTADLAVLAPAFAAGILVLATHVPFGQEVLRRGIVFIDLAIAQVAVLGVIVAEVLGFEPHGPGIQVVAALSALAAAGLLSWSERRAAKHQEALIGALFVLAASLALLLLSGNPHGAEHLKELLEGQILWVEPATLVPVMLLYTMVLALWFRARARFGPAGFYVLFALTVTASVQLVGVYLVFASLIIPALAASRIPERQRLPLAWLLGAIAYGGGLLLSLLVDVPAAPAIVCLLSGLAVLVWWIAPSVRGR